MTKPQSTRTEPEDSTATISVRIAVDHHSHHGIAIPRGGSIDVDADTAAWLRQHHIIED